MAMGVLQAAVAPKGLVFWLVTLAFGLLAAAVYSLNASHRRAVARALALPQPAARRRDSRAADTVRDDAPLVSPERLWRYDEKYLRRFVRAAFSRRTSFGDTALAHFIRPTLLYNDVIFALALGVFTALAALGLAGFIPWPWAAVMLVPACLGLVYAAVDFAEDLKLAQLLQSPERIDAASARAANARTQIKLLSLGVSVAAILASGLIELVRRALPPFG
jgi:hypothetical protein